MALYPSPTFADVNKNHGTHALAYQRLEEDFGGPVCGEGIQNWCGFGGCMKGTREGVESQCKDEVGGRVN